MGRDKEENLTDKQFEKKLLDEIDIDTIINDFASRNVRRNFWSNMYKLFDMNIALIYTLNFCW